MLHSRMAVCVERILHDHMQIRTDTSKNSGRVSHKYSVETTNKSEMFSLGLLDADPSSHEGVLNIMLWLHENCVADDQNIIPLLCNGDGLSIDRMRTAKERRCRGPTSADRLKVFVPSPQEFHLEALLLQVA